MKLVDVHCHLNHKDFKDNLNEVLKRQEEAGVKAIVISGINTPSNREVLELSKKYPIIKASLGMHPIDAIGLSEGETGLPKQTAKLNIDEELKFIEEHKDEIVSIGEIGLDFHWADKEKTYQQQAENFRKIIKLAIKINKPIVIHTWEGEEECINILEDEVQGKIPVILHCFSGRKSLITRAKELGYYFSVPPSILRTGNFQTLVKKVPLTQILTETDAPWQTPYKGQINEPRFVIETIKKIAEIKQLSEEEVADQIWNNFVKVFK
ncbi:MAG: TatD family hydrolase [Candidatus Woesearchaeota archaeon]